MRAAVTAETLNQYTPDLIEPLREEAARVLGRERDADFEVVGCEGAQAGIALALLAGIDPGDEVIVADPGYFHVPSAVIAAGGRPVTVPARPRMDPDAIAAALGPRTRAVVLVDPSNPYGTVLADGELTALVALAERHGLLLIHDVTHGALVLEAGEPRAAMAPGAVATLSVSHCWGMAGARIGFLAGPRALMRGCLQVKAAITRLNTSLVAQHGALAALRDEAYLPRAEATIRANLAHLELPEGLRLAVRPQRGLACAVEVDTELCSAQELMVALFARRIAVYPGDGLGDSVAADTIRLNLSQPGPAAMERLRAALPEALAEAASGRWREPVAALLERKGTPRALRVAEIIRRRS